MTVPEMSDGPSLVARSWYTSPGFSVMEYGTPAEREPEETFGVIWTTVLDTVPTMANWLPFRGSTPEWKFGEAITT